MEGRTRLKGGEIRGWEVKGWEVKVWEEGEEGKEMKKRDIQFNKRTLSFNLYLNELEITLIEIQFNKKKSSSIQLRGL